LNLRKIRITGGLVLANERATLLAEVF